MKTFKNKVDTLAEEGFLAWFWGRSGRAWWRKGPFLGGGCKTAMLHSPVGIGALPRVKSPSSLIHSTALCRRRTILAARVWRCCHWKIVRIVYLCRSLSITFTVYDLVRSARSRMTQTLQSVCKVRVMRGRAGAKKPVLNSLGRTGERPANKPHFHSRSSRLALGIRLIP